MSLKDLPQQIDDGLLDYVFEPIAWRIEYKTEGRVNNYTLARITAVAGLVFVLGAILSTIPSIVIFTGTSLVIGGMMVVMGGIMVFATYQNYLAIDRLEKAKSPYNRLFRPLGRSLRIFEIVFCLLFTGFISIGISHPLWIVALGSMTLSSYFTICSGMPPEWREARDKKKAGNLALKPKSI